MEWELYGGAWAQGPRVRPHDAQQMFEGCSTALFILVGRAEASSGLSRYMRRADYHELAEEQELHEFM